LYEKAEFAVHLFHFYSVSKQLSSSEQADVKLGDVITRENAAQADTLLTPATRWMVERGMRMSVIDSKKISWPRAYHEATDKYAGQVKLAADGGRLFDYVAAARSHKLTCTTQWPGLRLCGIISKIRFRLTISYGDADRAD
jgi:hypothetical protein